MDAKKYLKRLDELSIEERPVMGGRRFYGADWTMGAPTFYFSFGNESEAKSFLRDIEYGRDVTYADLWWLGKQGQHDVRIQFRGKTEITALPIVREFDKKAGKYRTYKGYSSAE